MNEQHRDSTDPSSPSMGQAGAVSAPKSSAALYHLLLNVFCPGLGSLFYRRFRLLLGTLMPLIGAVLIALLSPNWNLLWIVPLLLLWWLISFIGGIWFYLTDPWGTPPPVPPELPQSAQN